MEDWCEIAEDGAGVEDWCEIAEDGTGVEAGVKQLRTKPVWRTGVK